MKKILLMMILLLPFILPVSGMEFVAPEAPEMAEEYMPEENSSFGEDLWYVLKAAAEKIIPETSQAARTCLSVVVIVILVCVLQNFSTASKKVAALVGTLGIGALLMQPTSTLVQMSADTVIELTEYGRMLLPVMAAALAAQGATTSSTALYMGTVVLDTVLSALISKVLIPIIYIYICLCIAYSALKEQTLKNLRDFGKWLITWSLKTMLYVFTGYMGITGAVSGATDAAALKAAKLTISGSVPVVGNILSDASEAILVSANVMKNSVGTYGLIAIIAMFIGPFLKIGIQYLLLKLTAGVCNIFDTKDAAQLVQDISAAMGLILAMTGTVCLLLLISTVCFMKGVS